MNKEKSKEVISNLLDFAVKYAEQNDDADDIEKAWDTIDTARLFLAQPETPATKEQLLAALKASGLEFEDCVVAFAEDNNNPYVVAGREMMEDGDLEMDDNVVISEGEDGAYVFAWKFVSKEYAGIEDEDGNDGESEGSDDSL